MMAIFVTRQIKRIYGLSHDITFQTKALGLRSSIQMIQIPTVLFDISIFENDNKPKPNRLRSKDQSNFARFTELLKKEFFNEGFLRLVSTDPQRNKKSESCCSQSFLTLLYSFVKFPNDFSYLIIFSFIRFCDVTKGIEYNYELSTNHLSTSLLINFI